MATISDDPVVITGIGGRFPESENLDEFWFNLLSGKQLCTKDDRRWPVGKFMYTCICDVYDI